jgi:prolyl-tRNA editing enzyme YbaK/EbsC (Cys-tRNA(Pro) deacylase)
MEYSDAATTDLEERVLKIARTFDPDLEAVRIDPDLADTADFCAHYGYALEESGNCIIVRSKSGELRYAACLVQATRRLDLNRHTRLLVEARKASFASPDETVDVTGMVPGGVTPFGLPESLPVFVDEPIMRLDRVIVGGGGRGLKLRLRPDALLSLPTVQVKEIGRDPAQAG